jgi:hypothetical protein
MTEEEGHDRPGDGSGSERGRGFVHRALRLDVPVDDEVGVEAAGGGACLVDTAVVGRLKEAAAAVVAGKEVGLSEREANRLAVFKLEELDRLEAGGAGEVVDVAVVHGDGEDAAAGGLAGIGLADE